MGSAVIRGDAARLPLPDASVDLIVTSPPYFGLRSYTDGGEHYAGQVGAEPTPAEYVAALLDCTREWARVLKPTGSLFVNLGDSYSGGSRSTYDRTDINGQRGAASRPRTGIRGKSLVGLPWRYALGCIDQLGLILRAEVVWSKPNGLPESVTDRVRRSHEQIFHFTRQPRYYSGVDEIREPHARVWNPARNGRNPRIPAGTARGSSPSSWAEGAPTPHALGKLPGSVWDIASQPLKVPASLDVDHFAAFPFELPRRVILGWSPPGICTACGEGRRPVHDGSEKTLHRPSGAARVGARMAAASHSERERTNCGNVHTVHRIVGYACACPDAAASTRPAVVLDPFGGTGTTALVADVLGRTGISVDMSADYCRLARWRTTDRGERARAMQVPKPPPVPEGMDALFDLEAAHG